MCHLYRITTSVDAHRQLVRGFNGPDLVWPGEIFPNYEAPVFRKVASGVELAMLRWGVPLPPQDGRKPKPVVNVRNVASPFWRSLVTTPARRCLVPANAFSEWSSAPNPMTGKKELAWFEVTGAESFCFAGILRPTPEGERFAFLTTEPNALIAPIHPQAMPVILNPSDYETWLTGDPATAARAAYARALIDASLAYDRAV